MNVLHLDGEMFCEVPIKHGTHAYGEKAEILLTTYAWNDNPVDVLEEFDPAQIQAMVDEADLIVIHNSFFDRTVYGYNGVNIPVEKIEDTMVTAYAHGLPGALDQLCDVLDVVADKAKHKEGKKLINLFCKPRPKNMKLRRATKETHPEEWARFVEYARYDIVSMRECRRLLPRWNLTTPERKLWLLDQKINDRGVKVDMDLAHAALRAAGRAQEMLAARMDKLTDGKVKSATQRAVLKAHLEDDHDFSIVDMTKGSVAAALKGDMSDETRELLEIRQQAATTSSAKYPVLIRSSSSRDRRLRGTLQFCGASRTQRWGGRLFQPQNLMRPTMRQDQIDLGIAAMLADCEDLLFENVMELCGNAVRGALIAEKAKKFVVADLSNIEGRVVAWLAGEEWKVKAFQEYDRGIGHDIYVLAYAKSFGVTPETVIADKKYGVGLMRAVGKVQELACVSENTRVFTSHGIKAMVDVSIDDLLWDGIEWVRHEGLVARGVKPVVNVNGIFSTADHLFLTTQGWKQAQQLVSNRKILDQALEIGSESLPSQDSLWALLKDSVPLKFSARAARKNTQSTFTIYAEENRPAVLSVLKRKSRAIGRIFINTLMKCPMIGTADVCLVGWPRAKLDVTVPPQNNITPMVAEAYVFAKRGAQIAANFLLTSKRWMGGTNRVLTWIVSTTKKVTSQVIYVLSRAKKIVLTNEQYEKCKHASPDLKNVYDIAYAGPRNRFTILSDTGPLIVHNCGYGGAVGSFAKMASIYGVELSEEKMIESVRAWRKANSKIVSFWYDLEYACRLALRNKGDSFTAGVLTMDRVDHEGKKWLRIKAPSGSYLSYPNADERDDGKLVYDGIDQYTHQWTQLDTYGPKLLQNITEKVARDILAEGMKKAEAAGYEVCLHAHDELITETPDEERFSDKELSSFMVEKLPWTLGLPLAAAGFSTQRYKKDQS